MQLWTIQTAGALEALERDGRLLTERLWGDADFLPAYDWLCGEMERRIGPPPRKGLLPIWAWRQYESATKRRPDLRRSCHLPRGEQGCRIEFLVDEAAVVQSDFQLWHYVLNYGYLPESAADADQFDARCGGRGYSWNHRAPARLAAEMQTSWQRIFDLPWHAPTITLPLAKKQIQATLWELNADCITNVTRFIAR